MLVELFYDVNSCFFELQVSGYGMRAGMRPLSFHIREFTTAIPKEATIDIIE
jgi:hypothetical protein